MKKILAFFTASSIGAAHAITNIMTPLPPSMWVITENATQTAVGPPVGSTATPQPSWGIIQYYIDSNGNDVNMPAAQKFRYSNGSWNNYVDTMYSGTNTKWLLSNASASVGYDAETQPWLGGVYTLGQDGQITPVPCDGESDLFLQPKGNLTKFGPLASSAPDGFNPYTPPLNSILSGLTSIKFHTGLEIIHENETPKCAPQFNQVSYALGIFFRNINDNSTFFYQLTLRSTFDTTPAGGWYGGFQDSGGNSGVGDYIDNLGYPRATYGGGRIAYSGVELAPRIKNIISQGWAYDGAGPSIITFDGNLDNWRLDGFFAGQFLWGGMQAQSAWDNIFLQISPP